MLAHRAKFHAQQGDRSHEDECEKGIEIVRNALDKQRDAVCFSRHKAAHRRCPGRDRREDADRRCCGVDEIGELGARDLKLVGDGTHHSADGETVEIIVDKNDHAKADRRQLRRDAVFDPRLRPAAKRCRAARAVHQRDDDAEDHEKDQDADVVGVGKHGHDAFAVDVVDRSLQGKAGIQQPAADNAGEERAIDLLGHECQRDRHKGWQQRPDRLLHRVCRGCERCCDQERCKDEERSDGPPLCSFCCCHHIPPSSFQIPFLRMIALPLILHDDSRP